MNLQQRKELLVTLGNYMLRNEEQWQSAKQKASVENHWFIPEFVELSVKNIAESFLKPNSLQQLIDHYSIPQQNYDPKKIGIVMAGNIPLVGFHDLLCVFLTGHYAIIKPSSKDEVLITLLVNKLIELNRDAEQYFTISTFLKNCDAYIATGSNNSSRYFDYYFKDYPTIIRKNRTSVAVLTGSESNEDLEKLADDVYSYFGLGCRNVTKIYVPHGYDFIPLLETFKKYDYLATHHKYKNNYDYNLAVHIINNKYYMSTESILLVEDSSPFSPISQLNYEYYTDIKEVQKQLKENQNIQCIVSKDHIGFGGAQCPNLQDYADGVDTIKFLLNLEKQIDDVKELRRP